MNDYQQRVIEEQAELDKKDIEREIKELVAALGIDAPACGYAYLNTTVAEVLFRGGHGMSGNEAKPVFRAEIVRDMLLRVRALSAALEDANSLCRSAYQIAERSGSANWPAFRARLAESLDRQHAVMYPQVPNAKGNSMELQPHQQRVVDEKTELDKKAILLSQFIGYSSVFDTLSPEEQERLKEQNDVMWQYSEILGARIAAFK